MVSPITIYMSTDRRGNEESSCSSLGGYVMCIYIPYIHTISLTMHYITNHNQHELCCNGATRTMLFYFIAQGKATTNTVLGTQQKDNLVFNSRQKSVWFCSDDKPEWAPWNSASCPAPPPCFFRDNISMSYGIKSKAAKMLAAKIKDEIKSQASALPPTKNEVPRKGRREKKRNLPHCEWTFLEKFYDFAHSLA